MAIHEREQGPSEAPPGAADTERAAALLAARLPERLGVFARLAYDFAWSWHPGGDALFRSIDAHRWEKSGHNPVRLLLETPPSRLAEVSADDELLARADALALALDRPRSESFESGADSRAPIAFLCAEFAVHPSLRLYSGGLGVLAGDFLREASDLGFPLVGVGLFYREGYFRQRLDPSGWQHEYWVEREPSFQPLALVTDSAGVARTVQVEIRGRPVVFQIWRVAVGRTPLYLLDADRPENERIDRWITARLYDSDRETRLAQYAALGLGSMRALAELGIEPSVVHMNEGHAALAAFELLRKEMAGGRDYEQALAATRERVVFTTHTPVAAGNESYPPDQVWSVVGSELSRLEVDPKTLLGLGRFRPDDPAEALGLSVLAFRTSRGANAVSRVHGDVSRDMWKQLWGRPAAEVPISHVTNGVHLPTWMSEPMSALLRRYLGEDFEARAADPGTWDAIDDIPDAELWAVRCELRSRLVTFLRDRTVADRLARGEGPHYVQAAARALEPDALTIGFARRLATYKRLHLLASDTRRGIALLKGDRPVQIVVAGKAHPNDDEAKQLLQRIFGIKHDPAVAARVAYVEDYEAATAARIVSGCDVWLNLPRPPLEASGTSGMKAALNGCLNLSVLDGWWAEAYSGDNGWAIPAEPGMDERERDERDGRILYDLLEGEVLPLFHDRDADGVPRGWVRRVRATLRSNGPAFNTTRMLRDYGRSVYPNRGERG